MDVGSLGYKRMPCAKNDRQFGSRREDALQIQILKTPLLVLRFLCCHCALERKASPIGNEENSNRIGLSKLSDARSTTF